MTEGRQATKSGQLWGGRFRAPADPSLSALSRSPESYFALAPYDLAGSRAHARELQRAGILTAHELKQMLNALDSIENDFVQGLLHPQDSDEDVHGFLERILMDRLGELGGKLRAGRSRNDQTANDLRLYLRDNARHLVAAICELQQALMGQAEQHIETAAPGFTHLQPAQPIVFGHQLLAHAQSFSRDIHRLQDWDWRSATCPLGSAALAGSAIALTPEHSAAELHYERSFENSMDVVASRDHVAEFLFFASMHAVNLSRLSEEICLWASHQFGWIELHDSFATGSSIMPQKKNPDIAELTRGKCGRVLGNLSGLLATLKSLPLAYNRDLAEDKAAVMEAVETLMLVLPAMSGTVRTFNVRVEALERQAAMGFTLATEVADHLARNGVAFSEAHEITGKLVRFCEQENVQLEQVSESQLKEIDGRLDASLTPHLSVTAALNARCGRGGTAPARVREQLERLRALTETQQGWASDYSGPTTGRA